MARRDFISQYAEETVGIGIFENGAYVDPTGNSVTITILREADTTTIINAAAATRDDVGLYSYKVSIPVTATKGDYTATWNYTIAATARVFTYKFKVVDPQPYWDSLSADQKQIVENVYFKVSDTFDSTVGGPYLWELPQTSFGYETAARLMVIDAMNLINFSKPKAFIPPYQVGASVQTPFPPAWYGLLEKATFYELCKHLARSYLEQPTPVGVEVARLDRRDYHDKWMALAQYEKEELEEQIAMLKRTQQFGLYTRALLQAGGIFPTSFLNPARPRWPYVLTRFY